MQISLSIVDIVSAVQVPASVVDLPNGGQEMTFLAGEESKALVLARKLARQLGKYNVKSFSGTRAASLITLSFGTAGATPPASWTAKSSTKSEKPETLLGVKTALVNAGFEKVSYYNSGSVTQKEGLVVSDSRIPIGLQFALDENDDLVARTQLSGGKWFEALIDGPDQAIRIATNATKLFDLS